MGKNSRFQTNKGADGRTVFSCNYDEMESLFPTIAAILSPSSLLRDYPDYEIDTGKPIGPGLRSIVRVNNGEIVLESNSLNHAPLIGLTMSITAGSIERNEEGKLEAYIETTVPFRPLQLLNEKLGLHSLALLSESDILSFDHSKPTYFTGSRRFVLPQGESVLDLMTWQQVQLPEHISVRTETWVSGYLVDKMLRGNFVARLLYENVPMTIGLSGVFHIHII